MKQEVKQEELIQSIIDNLDDSSKHFAFLLGAGASVTSGIPLAGELATKWLEQLKSINPEKHKLITSKQEFDANNLANLYSTIYQQRFEHLPGDGYHEIEKIMTDTKVDPSLGYIVLASFLLETDNNVIITTNFDRLPETALLTVFNAHAKVIYHEKFLPLIKIDNKKPTVIKIHNDALFEPNSNTQASTALSDDWEKIIKRILDTYCLIVLGYGGNDREGLMQYLTETANANPIYWCYRQEKEIPSSVIEKGFYCVKIIGFDEFMYALDQNLPESKNTKLDKIRNSIKDTAAKKIKNLEDKIDKLSNRNQQQDNEQSTQEFLAKFVADSWWDYQLKIIQETDKSKQDELYQGGLEKFPQSVELMVNYANFLKNTSKDYDKAEQYYHEALELDSDNAIINGSYAIFLSDTCKDYDKAEQYHHKALELDSNDAVYNGNYAGFLLAHGSKKLALPYLEKAEQLAVHDNLTIELLFYRLAHFPESYPENKRKLNKLLDQGVRSVGWNFDANIDQAKKEGSVHIDELRQLAKAITN